MRNNKYFENNHKKRLFFVFGIFNFLITNLVLQLLLLLFPIFISTILSQLVNTSLGLYFYGKKVFKYKKLTPFIIKKYLLLAIVLWMSNSFLIKLLNDYGINKNISAILIVPLIAYSSYYFQNKFVFVKD